MKANTNAEPAINVNQQKCRMNIEQYIDRPPDKQEICLRMCGKFCLTLETVNFMAIKGRIKSTAMLV